MRRLLDAGAARLFKVPQGHHDYLLQRAVPVSMRDGVTLLADVYRPVGTSSGTILVRTPYGRGGVVAFLTARLYATHGYTVVNQSCRGTAGSGGVFEPFVREVDDGADTVAWLRAQPWFDSRLALCGPSYLGFTAWAVMMHPVPELVTAVIAVAGLDNHRVAHGAGTFSLEQMLSLMDNLDHLDDGPLRGMHRLATSARRVAPGFEDLPLVAAQDTVLGGSRMPYREWLTTPAADAPLWEPMRLNHALDQVDVPVLLQAGWQDRFPDDMIDQYQHLHRRGADVALTIGPWTHVELMTKGAGPVGTEALDWLQGHLGDPGSDLRTSADSAPVRIFVTGHQAWRRLRSWPPPTTDQVFHLHPNGLLVEEPPPPDGPPTTFRYDPVHPTPTVGGRIVNPSLGGRRDNRRLERRGDVVTFTGPVLTRPLEVIGNPVVDLVQRSDNPYADLFVRLCEVSAKGRSINLADGFRRLSPDDDGDHEDDDHAQIRLEAVAHRFEPGTRIRLQISGGSHPRYARNLGTEENPATGTALAGSRRSIHHGAGGTSRLHLPISTIVPRDPDHPRADQVASPRSGPGRTRSTESGSRR